MFVTDAPEVLLPGSIYFVVMLVGLCFWGYARPHGPAGRLRGVWLSLALWSWAFSTPALANLIVREVEGALPAADAPRPSRDERSLIVVLASGEMSSQHGQAQARLDAAGWQRLHAAVQLWRSTGGRLLMVGGAGPETASFAHAMADIARDMGVPDAAIGRAWGSSRTYEDLQIASPVIRAHDGPIWLVTSALHMPRSLAVASKLGLPMRPHRCDYRQLEAPTWRAWLPNNGGPALFSDVLHELLGRQYYRLRGWAA